jgi:hypothetical protein
MSHISINWDGREYKVADDQAFELIEAIERHITLPELMVMIAGGKPNFAALARPFHAMLTHAGVRKVPSLLELRRMLVAEGLASMKSSASGDTPVTGAAMNAIAAMVEILMDGAPDMGEEDVKKKPSRKGSPKAVTKLQSESGE